MCLSAVSTISLRTNERTSERTNQPMASADVATSALTYDLLSVPTNDDDRFPGRRDFQGADGHRVGLHGGVLLPRPPHISRVHARGENSPPARPPTPPCVCACVRAFPPTDQTFVGRRVCATMIFLFLFYINIYQIYGKKTEKTNE